MRLPFEGRSARATFEGATEPVIVAARILVLDLLAFLYRQRIEEFPSQRIQSSSLPPQQPLPLAPPARRRAGKRTRFSMAAVFEVTGDPRPKNIRWLVDLSFTLSFLVASVMSAPRRAAPFAVF